MKNPEKMQCELARTTAGQHFLRAINHYGSASALAAALGAPKQRVDNWIYLMGRPSKEGAAAIDALNIGVTKEQLRPDIEDHQWVQAIKIDHRANLMKTPRGCGLLTALERCGNSTQVLAKLVGLNRPQAVQDWIERGYIPKRHIRTLLALPEFEGITGKMLRPDLHELAY